MTEEDKGASATPAPVNTQDQADILTLKQWADSAGVPVKPVMTQDEKVVDVPLLPENSVGAFALQPESVEPYHFAMSEELANYMLANASPELVARKLRDALRDRSDGGLRRELLTLLKETE